MQLAGFEQSGEPLSVALLCLQQQADLPVGADAGLTVAARGPLRSLGALVGGVGALVGGGAAGLGS